MRKINLEDVKKVAKLAYQIGACIFIATIAFGTKIELIHNIDKEDIVPDYYKTIEKIIDSDMFDYNKQKVINMLKPNAESGYYEAIIKILDSDMFDYNKISLIEDLSK